MPHSLSIEGKWRAAWTIIGTLGYWPLFRPDWRNPYLILYDVPTLMAAWGFAGSLAWRVYTGLHARRNQGTELTEWIQRDFKQAGIATTALLLAVGCATGAEFADWPLSGHLTIATTVGILEWRPRRNALLLRIAAVLPIVLLILIRTFWPQIPRMDNVGNTIRALLVGVVLGVGCWLASIRSY